MGLKLYYDLLSQPARSLYILFKLANIPFEECGVNLGKGEHRTEEFANTKSLIKKIPFIHDGNFRLNESIAIVRYLSREYSLPDKWYPKDSKKQAKADEYLEWHHLNVRLNCSRYFLSKWLLPLKTGKPLSNEQLKDLTKHMEKSLKEFERIFLSHGNRYIFGNTISYADIHAACEMEQTRMAGYDVRNYFPKIKIWIENVRTECNPVYDEAHKYANMIAAANEKKLNAKL